MGMNLSAVSEESLSPTKGEYYFSVVRHQHEFDHDEYAAPTELGLS